MLLQCYLNQVVVDCRDVRFLPRDYDVQCGADLRVVRFLPREYVVDGRGGYVEVDLDQCFPIAIDLNVLPSNHGGTFAKFATL